LPEVPFNIYNPSKYIGDEKPVERISFYDVYTYLIRANDIKKKQLQDYSSKLGIKVEDIDSKFWENRIVPNDTSSGKLAVSIVDKILLERYNNGKVIFRLPSEAEFEYVLRTGGFSFITDDLASDFDVMRSEDNGMTHKELSDYSRKLDLKAVRLLSPVAVVDVFETSEVCSKQPDSYGACDMFGNVGEWTNTITDQKCDLTATPEHYHVVKGCTWGIHAFYCLPSERLSNNPVARTDSFGFRLVRAQK
jgi:hypothetical protein